MISKWRKVVGTGLLAIATALFGVNTAGYVAGEQFYWKADPKHDLQRTYVPIAELNDLNRADGEGSEDYVRRITNAVALHMLHYWVSQDERESWRSVARMYVPVTENYVLHFKGIKDYLKGKARGMEFYDAELGLRRGYGYCSQQAMVLVDILNENGVPATKVGLEGHVVAEAEVGPGAQWILDADYNVVIPHSMREIETHPQLVRVFYEQAGYPEKTVDLLQGIYEASGNVYISLSKQLAVKGAQDRYLRWMYFFKWLIPTVLFLFGLWAIRHSRLLTWRRAVAGA